MKANKLTSLIGFAGLLIIMIAFIPACNESAEEEVINTEELATVDIKVEGMTCSGCENHIKNAVMELNGINSAELSHIDANAVVEYDKTQSTEQEIIDAINASGYKVVE